MRLGMVVFRRRRLLLVLVLAAAVLTVLVAAAGCRGGGGGGPGGGGGGGLEPPGMSGPWPWPSPVQLRVEVPALHSPYDLNGNGTPTSLDIVAGARGEVEKQTRYTSAYFAGGYPPDGEGACTDIIWVALAHAGYDLKAALDADIAAHPRDYPRARPADPNIDFRRVPNQVVFFEKYGTALTTELWPGDVENLVEWQAGDIVVWGPRYEHIGIISDRRRADGVPLVIHNAGPVARENDALRLWPSGITHHFRFPAW